MNREFALILLTAIAIAMGTWLFLDNFERRTEMEEIGFQGEANRNPLLALQRFLEASGVQINSVESILRLNQLPGPHDVMFLPTQRYDMGAERAENFRSWVESGGHLIVVGREPLQQGGVLLDPLLGPLGIYLEQDAVQYVEDESKRESEPEKGKPDKEEQPEQTVAVVVEDGTDPYQIAFRQDRHLWVEGDREVAWVVSDDSGAYLLEYAMGNGWLTVLSDAEFATNLNIARHDHAAFLWRLLHVDGRRETAWLVYRGDMPALASLLWRYGWPMVISLALLLLFWLWLATRRLGPIATDPSPARRSLREHIQASGRFLWRHGYRQPLLDAARQGLQRRLQERHPGWENVPERERFQYLAQVSDIEVELVRKVMTTEEVNNEAALTDYIKTIQYIGYRL